MVTIGYAAPPVRLMRFSQRDANGQFFSAPAIGIAIANEAGGNVVTTGKNIDARLPQLEAELPLGIQLHRIAWQSDLVVDSISEFMISLGLAVAIVLVRAAAAGRLAIGVVIGTALLLTLLATFIVMAIIGEDLHRMSLGALVIALGMMIDNAIVVADNFLVRLQQGMERKQAAIEAAAAPVLAAARGDHHRRARLLPDLRLGRERRRVLPGAVHRGRHLAAPQLGDLPHHHAPPADLPDSRSRVERRRARTAHGGGLLQRPSARCSDRRSASASSFLGGLVGAAGRGGRRVPGGAATVLPRCRSRPVSHRLLGAGGHPHPAGGGRHPRRSSERLLEDPRVVGVSTFIGSGPPRFYLPVDSELPYQSYANIIVNTTSGDVVPALADEMTAWLEDNVEQALVRVRLYALGPSNPWSFQARIMGPEGRRSGGAAPPRRARVWPSSRGIPGWRRRGSTGASACARWCPSSTRSGRAGAAVSQGGSGGRDQAGLRWSHHRSLPRRQQPAAHQAAPHRGRARRPSPRSTSSRSSRAAPRPPFRCRRSPAASTSMGESDHRPLSDSAGR